MLQTWDHMFAHQTDNMWCRFDTWFWRLHQAPIGLSHQDEWRPGTQCTHHKFLRHWEISRWIYIYIGNASSYIDNKCFVNSRLNGIALYQLITSIDLQHIFGSWPLVGTVKQPAWTDPFITANSGFQIFLLSMTTSSKVLISRSQVRRSSFQSYNKATLI